MKIACTLICILLAPSSSFASLKVYGNDNGCHRYATGYSRSDDSITFTAEAVEYHETTCWLPKKIVFSGKPMKVTCSGEGEEWEDTISLKRAGNNVVLDGKHILHLCKQ